VVSGRLGRLLRMATPWSDYAHSVNLAQTALMGMTMMLLVGYHPNIPGPWPGAGAVNAHTPSAPGWPTMVADLRRVVARGEANPE
jgi:hypothetical protein